MGLRVAVSLALTDKALGETCLIDKLLNDPSLIDRLLVVASKRYLLSAGVEGGNGQAFAYRRSRGYRCTRVDKALVSREVIGMGLDDRARSDNPLDAGRRRDTYTQVDRHTDEQSGEAR
jgi:hypothetical protein